MSDVALGLMFWGGGDIDEVVNLAVETNSQVPIASSVLKPRELSRSQDQISRESRLNPSRLFE